MEVIKISGNVLEGRNEMIRLIARCKDIYKEEKKDKRQFDKVKKQMEKIAITQKQLQKLISDEISRSWPSFEIKFEDRVVRTVELIVDAWKDIDRKGLNT
jgi:hypothetical protein